MHIGWDRPRRVHGSVLHIDIINRQQAKPRKLVMCSINHVISILQLIFLTDKF